jgi:hypothetical protein
MYDFGGIFAVVTAVSASSFFDCHMSLKSDCFRNILGTGLCQPPTWRCQE